MTQFVKLNFVKAIMEDRRPKVLEVALDLFVRHGFKRTTMGDIAEAADMSRPSLYLLYSNKEEIFRSVIENHYEEALEKAWTRIKHAKRLTEKLEAVLRTWVIEPFELVRRSPDARELYECAHSFALDVRERLMGLLISQLEEVLASSPEVDEDLLEIRGLNINSLACLVAHSSMGIKCSVPTLEELELLVKTLVHMAVGACGKWK